MAQDFPIRMLRFFTLFFFFSDSKTWFSKADGGWWPQLGYWSFHFGMSLLVDMKFAGDRNGYNSSHFKLGNW